MTSTRNRNQKAEGGRESAVEGDETRKKMRRVSDDEVGARSDDIAASGSSGRFDSRAKLTEGQSRAICQIHDSVGG